MKSGIKYSNCWEDAYALQESLQVNNESRVLSIASGGDNTLYLLSKHPASMHCIDSNEEQLFVTQLKACAIQYLEYEAFLAFLGFTDSNERMNYYDQIKRYLPMCALEYFDNHNFLIKKGIIHQGKFEVYFQLFAKKILPFIHSSSRRDEMFFPKTATEQEVFYNKRWNNRRWRFMFRVFFSRTLMSRIGRDSDKFKHVQQNVATEAFSRASKHLQSVDAVDNYLLNYCVYGYFKDLLPPYALQNNFRRIKSWLQDHSIEYNVLSFQEYIKQPSKATCLNLSNIFEYQSEAEFEGIQNLMNRNIASDACLSYWELFNAREMLAASFACQETNTRDFGFFYAGIKSYRKK